MRITAVVSATIAAALIATLPASALAQEQATSPAAGMSQDEKNRRDELIKKAVELRAAAQDYLQAGLAEWERNASEKVKNVSEKVVDLKKSFGKTMTSLADAYEKYDKKVFAQLEEQRTVAERQLDLAEKEKFVATKLDEFRNALAETPDSAEMSKLYEAIKKKADTFLDLSRKINDLEIERAKLEREARKLGKEFEIAQQRHVLNKLEKSLKDGDVEE